MDETGLLRSGPGLALLVAAATSGCATTPPPTEVEQYEVDQWDVVHSDQTGAANPQGAPAATDAGAADAAPAEPPKKRGWPECQPSGPAVGSKMVGQVPGTDGTHNVVVTVQVTNPGEIPIWVFPAVVGELPSKIERGVTLKRGKPAKAGAEGALVWQLSEHIHALRVPGGATVLLSSSAGPFKPRTNEKFAVALAQEVSIGGKSATDWLGHAGLSPASGELTTIILEATERERRVADGEDASLRVGWLCALEFPATPFRVPSMGLAPAE